MRNENRKRYMQVNFRLTPEEHEKFTNVIGKSGMSQNDYFIQEIINKVRMHKISIYKKFQDNHLEITFNLGKKLIGFASCSYYETLKQVEIHSLFASDKYDGYQLMEMLLNEVNEFAQMNRAQTIKTTIGAEPFSEWGQIPLEQEESFYQNAGFVRKEISFGNIPCMIKTL